MGMAREATAETAAAAGTGAGSRSGKGSSRNTTAKDILMSKAAGLLRQRPRGVFSFPAFTPEFCKLLREEKEHYEQSGMPCVPPNTMNKNGLLLYELGMYEGLLDPLLRRYILPLSAALYGTSSGGGGGQARNLKDDDATTTGGDAARGSRLSGGDSGSAGTGTGTGTSSREEEHTPGACTLDHSRSFTVSYEVGKTEDLAYHYDDAEITLNVNLGGDFEGGELLFGALQGDPPEAHGARYPHFHREGMGLMHRGAHCHEAVPVEEGNRTNLIMWCRSSDVRRHGKCAMCGRGRRDKTEMAAAG